MVRYLRGAIIVPRWFFTVKYLLLAIIGAATVLSASPTLEEASPNWYTPIWGACVGLSAVLAAIGSAHRETEWLEWWSAAILAGLLLSFSVIAFAFVLSGDLDRLVFSAIAFFAAGAPMLRVASVIWEKRRE